MAREVVMPRLSDTMETGTIAKWLKQEGEQVKKGDILAEIETDKANMELESYDTGILTRISVREGQSATVGEPIAVIAKDAAEADSIASDQRQTPAAPPKPPQAESAADNGRQAGEPASQESPQPAVEDVPASAPAGRIKASPLARRIAQEHGIDLADVTGTGPGGRVTKEDIQAYQRRSGQETPPQHVSSPDMVVPPQQGVTAPAHGRAPEPLKMSRMQQTIARRMAQAKFSAPEFVLTAEIDMTEARAMMASIKETEGAPRVGPNDLLIKAVALALAQHPEVNSGWENDTVVRYGRVNVGNAVALSDGLVVPVIRDADKKTLGQIARESKELIERARANKLAPAEYEGGTFSISNLGMYGIDQFTPIINVPEACILGVGSITPKPVVVDGQVVVRDRMRLTLSCDHRVVNGSQGAEFLQSLRRLLENPMLTLL